MNIGKLLGTFEVTSITIAAPERITIHEPYLPRAGTGRRSRRSLLPRAFRSMPRLRPVLEDELFDP
jgi:hypothetical protein